MGTVLRHDSTPWYRAWFATTGESRSSRCTPVRRISFSTSSCWRRLSRGHRDEGCFYADPDATHSPAAAVARAGRAPEPSSGSPTVAALVSPASASAWAWPTRLAARLRVPPLVDRARVQGELRVLLKLHYFLELLCSTASCSPPCPSTPSPHTAASPRRKLSCSASASSWSTSCSGCCGYSSCRLPTRTRARAGRRAAGGRAAGFACWLTGCPHQLPRDPYRRFATSALASCGLAAFAGSSVSTALRLLLLPDLTRSSSAPSSSRTWVSISPQQ